MSAEIWSFFGGNRDLLPLGFLQLPDSMVESHVVMSQDPSGPTFTKGFIGLNGVTHVNCHTFTSRFSCGEVVSSYSSTIRGIFSVKHYITNAY